MLTFIISYYINFNIIILKTNKIWIQKITKNQIKALKIISFKEHLINRRSSKVSIMREMPKETQMKMPALTTLMMKKVHFAVLKEIESQLM